MATFNPFTSSIDPASLTALQRLDLSGPEYEAYTVGVGDGEMTLYRPVNKIPSDYGAIYNGTGGDTGADPTPSGFYGPSQVVNGVPVTPYYDAQGNLEKYVGGATQNLSDSVRLSAEWDPTGKAAPVQWNTDNGLFNSGVTFDDAVKTAIIAATGYNALGPGAGATELGGSEALSGIDLGGVGASPNTWLGNSVYGAVPAAVGSTVAAGGLAGTAANLGTAGAVGSGIGSAVGGAAGGSILGTLGAATTIASGINAITGGGLTKALGLGEKAPTAAEAQKMADPFSSYRSKLAEMYSDYLTGGNNTDITQMPGYSQFESGVLNPALEATKRAGAKSGMLMSGNEQIALQKQGQTGYYGFMTDYLNRLATASGASVAPAQAANLGLAQGAANAQGVMQGMGGVATGLANLFGTNNTNVASTSSNTVGAGPAGYNWNLGSVDTSSWMG